MHFSMNNFIYSYKFNTKFFNYQWSTFFTSPTHYLEFWPLQNSVKHLQWHKMDLCFHMLLTADIKSILLNFSPNLKSQKIIMWSCINSIFLYSMIAKLQLLHKFQSPDTFVLEFVSTEFQVHHERNSTFQYTTINTR